MKKNSKNEDNKKMTLNIEEEKTEMKTSPIMGATFRIKILMKRILKMRRSLQNQDNSKNKGNSKIKDDPKNEEYPKNKDDLKNQHNLI